MLSLRVALWVIQVSSSSTKGSGRGRGQGPKRAGREEFRDGTDQFGHFASSTAAGLRRVPLPSTKPFLSRRSPPHTAALAGHTGKGKGANHTAGQPKQSRSYSNSLVTTGTKILYQLSTVDEGNGWMCPSTSPASSPATAPWNPMRDPRLLTSAAATKPHRVWDLESEQQQL
mmetsp:Transcript_88655/g.239875  ORF Transcript_88655/g.239875 Transcript_88655/m.239875 type:complete len:172 (+) Transcript_88655:98-613(+)